MALDRTWLLVLKEEPSEFLLGIREAKEAWLQSRRRERTEGWDEIFTAIGNRIGGVTRKSMG